MSIEAMKQALEALEQLQGGCTDSDDGTVEAITVWCPEVIDALRQAIEQAEQAQSVAQCMKHGECFGGKCIYTSLPPRQPLTGEGLVRAAQSCLSPIQYDHFEAMLENDPDAHNRLARVLEAAYGIKGEA